MTNPAQAASRQFRNFLHASVVLGVTLGASSLVVAQTYPSRPITIKVAFPAGGPADASIREANVVVQRNLNQTIVSENVPGATGSIAAMAALKAEPDGYTLLGSTGSDFVVAPITVASAKYQPEKFSLLGVTGVSDFVLVSNSNYSFKNIDDLIEYTKKPGNKELSLGHWGKGSTAHMVGADFQGRSGAKFLEVPYKGVAPAISDILGQHLDLTFMPLTAASLELIEAKKINAIAVTNLKRNPGLPNVPSINESSIIKDFDYSIWAAYFAPPNTPDPIVTRLNTAVASWITSPEGIQRAKLNASRDIKPMNLNEAAAFFKTEREKFLAVAKSLKLEMQ